MSKVAIDAATRDYMIKPRLEYRTLQGVNGPLVILEVRARRARRAMVSRAGRRRSSQRTRHRQAPRTLVLKLGRPPCAAL